MAKNPSTPAPKEIGPGDGTGGPGGKQAGMTPNSAPGQPPSKVDIERRHQRVKKG